MRNQAIQTLIAGGLSASLAESCVDAAGNIDQGKVETLKAGMSWGRNPASAANPQLVANLIEELKAATARREINAMMRIRSTLAKHGVFNPEV
jgi:hypothetical protein